MDEAVMPNRLVLWIRRFKANYRNKKLFKWLFTIILILLLFSQYLISVDHRINEFSDLNRVFNKNGYPKDFVIFFVTSTLVLITLVFSIWRGFGRTYKRIVFPITHARNRLSYYREAFVEILPQKWENQLEPAVIRRGVIGFLTIINALYFSTIKSDWGPSTTNFLDAFLYRSIEFSDFSIDWAVTFFWFLLPSSLIFSLSHHGKEQVEALKKQSTTLKEIKSAVLNAPNGVLEDYPELYSNFTSIVDELRENESFDILEKKLLEAFKIVSNLTEYFIFDISQKKDLKLCINFMIYVPRDAEDDSIFSYCYENKGAYKDVREEDIKGFLLFDGKDGLSQNSLQYLPPLTCLPVLKEKMAQTFMFGAYEAFSQSGYSYTNDVFRSIENYKLNDQNDLYEVANSSFSTKYGKEIKSLFSYSYDSTDYNVGVLNIHANVSNYLGSEKLYFPTFVSLMTPFAQMLAPFLLDYQKYLLTYFKSVKLEKSGENGLNG